MLKGHRLGWQKTGKSLSQTEGHSKLKKKHQSDTCIAWKSIILRCGLGLLGNIVHMSYIYKVDFCYFHVTDNTFSNNKTHVYCVLVLPILSGRNYRFLIQLFTIYRYLTLNVCIIIHCNRKIIPINYYSKHN